MKIYTYYENINFNKQNELIDVWVESWRKSGFEPVVLSRDDAKKSPLYDQYLYFVQKVHEEAVRNRLRENSYWLAAQLEIVAFSTVEEPSFFSDYDVISNGFKPFEPESKVYWRNADCSCFVTGGGVGWEAYIKFLFKNVTTIIEWCKNYSLETGRKEFGDQDFLIAIYQKGIKSKIFNGSRDLSLVGQNYDPESTRNCRAFHLSHDSIERMKEKYPKLRQYDSDELRVHFAKKIIQKCV